MTKEQIDKLEVGDVIRAEYTVVSKDRSRMCLRSANGNTHNATCTGYSAILDAASVVKPSHVFKAGDIARIIPDPLTGQVYGNGRSCFLVEGTLVRVVSGTADYGDVHVYTGAAGTVDRLVNVHCLEPTDETELDRYIVEEDGEKITVLDDIKRIAEYDKGRYPNCKAVAVAECARLNADWREQQKGKQQ